MFIFLGIGKWGNNCFMLRVKRTKGRGWIRRGVLSITLVERHMHIAPCLSSLPTILVVFDLVGGTFYPNKILFRKTPRYNSWNRSETTWGTSTEPLGLCSWNSLILEWTQLRLPHLQHSKPQIKVDCQRPCSSGVQRMVVPASDYGSARTSETFCSWGLFEYKKGEIDEVELLTLINLNYLAPPETVSGWEYQPGSTEVWSWLCHLLATWPWAHP